MATVRRWNGTSWGNAAVQERVGGSWTPATATLRSGGVWVTPPPPPPPPPTGTRIFTGDYSTGNFLQWQYISTKLWNGGASNGYVRTTVGYPDAYPADIVTDPVKGPVARYEVRPGDLVGSSESSQVSCTRAQTTGNGTQTDGQLCWYAMSMKFGTFPQNHASLGWGLVKQWHDGGNEAYSPSVAWYVDQLNGNVSLAINRQPAPGQYQAQFPIFNIPLGTAWHDIKMRVLWSRSDSVGSIQLWYNGVRQTFLQGPYGTRTDGNTTYVHRTMHPTSNTVYYKEGYYRRAASIPTGVVYHAGFRVATTESALG